MIRFDVSALTQARLGTSLTLYVDAGPQCLTDLEVDFLRGTIRAIRVEDGLLVQGTVESQLRLECVRCLESFAFPLTYVTMLFDIELSKAFYLSRFTLNALISTEKWIQST